MEQKLGLLNISSASQYYVLKTGLKKSHINSNLTFFGANSDIPVTRAALSGLALIARWPDLYPKWVRMAANGTNPGLFQIKFKYILSAR